MIRRADMERNIEVCEVIMKLLAYAGDLFLLMDSVGELQWLFECLMRHREVEAVEVLEEFEAFEFTYFGTVFSEGFLSFKTV